MKRVDLNMKEKSIYEVIKKLVNKENTIKKIDITKIFEKW